MFGVRVRVRVVKKYVYVLSNCVHVHQLWCMSTLCSSLRLM